MLDLMRRHAKSWIIKVALFGIIIVFALFFGWSGPRESDQSYVASINDEEISHGEYDIEMSRRREALRRRLGRNFSPEVLKELNLKKAVMDGLIAQRLFRQESVRLGFFVTDSDLQQDIAADRNFQVNGVFNARRYGDVLRDMRLESLQYEALRRGELLGIQFTDLIVDSVKTDPRELRRFWHFQNDKLALSYLLVKPDKAKVAKEPDKAELQAYFEKNNLRYEIPESVDFKYVAFSWEDAKKDLTVADEEAQDYFKAHPEEFVIPEKAVVRHILIKVPQNAGPELVAQARKKAEELLAKIKGGAKFEDVARSDSEDQATAEKGGALGPVAKGTISPVLEQVIFQLEPKKVSDPVRTSLGFHLLLVDEKTPEKEQEFKEVKDGIVKKLLEGKARSKTEETAEELYEQVYRSEDLEGTAKKFGMEVKTAESITQDGSIPGIGAAPKVIKEAFELEPDRISRLVKSRDTYVLIKLMKKTDARIPEFDEVADRVRSDYLEHLALQAAEKKAGDIIEELRKNPKDAESIAKKHDLTWQDIDPVSTVSSYVPKLGDSPQVKEMLTKVTKEDPVFGDPLMIKDGAAVVRLREVQAASNELFEAESDRVKMWIRAVRQEEFIRGWIDYLKQKSKININENFL